jgi:hypothetical protein
LNLLQGTYPTSDLGWQEVAAYLLCLHDGRGGRLRECLPAAGALNTNLQPKAALVQQLRQVAGASMEQLASKVDVLGLWKQVQYKAQQVLLCGQPSRAAAEQQRHEESEKQQQQQQEQQQQQPNQQQQPACSAADFPFTRAPGWDTPAERSSAVKGALKSK